MSLLGENDRLLTLLPVIARVFGVRPLRYICVPVGVLTMRCTEADGAGVPIPKLTTGCEGLAPDLLRASD